MFRDNLLKVKERIACVCAKFNRDPSQVAIVGVSKGRTVDDIRQAIAEGITEIGENKVQEARLKYNELSNIGYRLPVIKWHMVGHLQANKVKEAVKIFDLIQSVDSLHLAVEIDKQASRINKIQDVLIEVKTSPEAAKFGLNPEEAIEVIKEIPKRKNINLKGLMTIAPAVDNPNKARPYFKILRELLNKINELPVAGYQLRILSMGMSDDFEVALEEGSNMVRLGRAIFSEG